MCAQSTNAMHANKATLTTPVGNEDHAEAVFPFFLGRGVVGSLREKNAPRCHELLHDSLGLGLDGLG